MSDIPVLLLIWTGRISRLSRAIFPTYGEAAKVEPKLEVT